MGGRTGGWRAPQGQGQDLPEPIDEGAFQFVLVASEVVRRSRHNGELLVSLEGRGESRRGRLIVVTSVKEEHRDRSGVH